MAERLFISLSHMPEAAEWMLLDSLSGVARLHGAGSFDEFAEQLEELDFKGEVVAFVPGQDVVTTSAHVPTKHERQIVQALPYIVEEQLIEDVEHMHFAVGKRLDSGELAVAIVARDKMHDWLEQLRGVGVEPQVLAVEYLCVPSKGERTILLERDRALVRMGKYQGLSIEKDNLSLLLSLDDEETEVRFLVPSDSLAEEQLLFDQLSAERAGGFPVDELSCSPFETLCREFDASTINLRQQEFRASDQSSEHGMGWRAVAALAVAAIALHLLLSLAQGGYLYMEAESISADARSLYTDVFPNDSNVRDLRRRWQAHLRRASARTSDDFLCTFRNAAKNLQSSNLQLENVNFNETRGDLILQVRAPSSDQLVAYSQAVINAGLKAEIGTITQEENFVRGSVKIAVGSC